jgi:hypothetical protein
MTSFGLQCARVVVTDEDGKVDEKPAFVEVQTNVAAEKAARASM